VSASVAGNSGQGVPTGSVNLMQTLNGNTTPFPGNPYALNDQALTIVPSGYDIYSAYSPGTYTMSGIYSGDNSFNASSSPGITFTVTSALTNVSTNIPSCTPGPNPCVFGAGNFIQISAWVNDSAYAYGTLQPTGTATFYSNGTALAPPVPLDSGTSPPGASFQTTQMPLGLDSITVQYSGDGNYSGSTSPPEVIEVGASFSVTPTPSTINIPSSGQSGSTTLTFTALNGLTGTGTLSPSLCSNLPPYSTCSFSPSTVTFTPSTTSVNVTMKVTTSGSGSAVRHLSSRIQPKLMALSAFFLLSICLIPTAPRRRRPRPFLTLIALITIATAVACGGGSAGGGGGSGGNTTPPGTYDVTLNVAVGGVSQLVSINVDVQ